MSTPSSAWGPLGGTASGVTARRGSPPASTGAATGATAGAGAGPAAALAGRLPSAVGQATQRAARRRRRQRLILLLWTAPLALFVFTALVGPLLLPYDPVTTHTGDRLRPPGATLQSGVVAVLGTDQVGRDLLAQVLQGARISLFVAAATVLVAGTAGLVLGVLCGYYGGAIDTVVMRLADIQLGFPTILLAILIAAALGPSVANVIVTLSLTRWVTFGRVARAAALATKERDFILAARALGASDLRLLVRHIAPATLPPLIVLAAVEVGLVIIAEASLSFLGLGTPPGQPSWGVTVAQGRAYLNTAWWIATMPGAALSLVVLSVGVWGDRLRDYLDPRSTSGT